MAKSKIICSSCKELKLDDHFFICMECSENILRKIKEEGMKDQEEAYLKETGLDAEEAFESDVPEELSDADLDRLRFHHDPDDRSKTISFREQLENMVKASMSFPCFFGSTEF